MTDDDLWSMGFYDTGLDEILCCYSGSELEFHLNNFLFDHPKKQLLIETIMANAIADPIGI